MEFSLRFSLYLVLDVKPAAPLVGGGRHRRRAEFPPSTAPLRLRAAGVLVSLPFCRYRAI